MTFKKSLVEITELFIRQSSEKSLAKYVEGVRKVELEEENRRNDLLKKFGGTLVLTKQEVELAINSAVHQSYDWKPFSKLSFMVSDVEAVTAIQYLGSLLPLEHENSMVESIKDNHEILALKEIPLDERVEKILVHAMQKDVSRAVIQRIMGLRDDYELANCIDSTDDDSYVEREIHESRWETRYEYPDKVMMVIRDFLGIFPDVQDYIVEHHAIQFMEEKYSSLKREVVGEQAYFIFVT